MSLRLVFLSAFVALSTADFVKVGFKNCNSLATLNSVEAEGCALKELDGGKKACVFKQGSTPRIRINFTPNEDTTSLKTRIKAKVGSSSYLDFPMENDNSCQFGLSCPLKKGTAYTYSQDIEILDQYPLNENIQVNWVMSKGGEAKDVCFIFLVRIEA